MVNINPFKFNYKGYDILCLKERRLGIYGDLLVWRIVFKGPSSIKNFISKVEAKKDTVNWVKAKGIQLVNDVINPKVQLNEFDELFQAHLKGGE